MSGPTEESWFDSQQRQKFLLFFKTAGPALGPTRPSVQNVCVCGGGGFSRREAAVT